MVDPRELSNLIEQLESTPGADFVRLVEDALRRVDVRVDRDDRRPAP